MPDLDPHVSTWLEEDARRARTEVPELESLWAEIEQQVDAPGWRDPLVSARTPVRMLAGVAGVAVVGLAMVAVQGLRADLDGAGWTRFALLGVTLMALGIATALWPLIDAVSTRNWVTSTAALPKTWVASQCTGISRL